MINIGSALLAAREMSGSGRKGSKWDSRDHPQFEDGNVQDDGWAGKAGRSFYRRESGHGWQSPELAGTNGSKWSALETNDMRSRHDSGFPSREPFPGSRGSHKNENIDKDSNRYVTDTMAWDGDGHYSTRMSPGLDEWRHQSHSQSPREGWNRSLRGKSRSKSRSRSRSRSRSWSRSPGRGLRREPGFLDRSRSRSGASAQMSKDFTAGRCRSNQNYDDYWDRQRKGGSSKYSTPQDARDHPLRGGRSTNFCTDFVKGNCRRGASCKFEHHGASDGFGFGSENEFVREKDNDRRRRDTSTERGVGRESRRSNDIPCKFFAIGKCRNGKYCRFSHHTPEERASPDRKPSDRRALGRKSDDVERVWDGSKWSAMMPNAAKLTEDLNENVGASEPRSHSWSLNDRSGERLNNENKSCGDPTGHEAAKGNDKEALRLKADIGGTGMDHSESRPSEKWLDDMDMSPDWNYNVQSSNHVDTCKQSGTLDASGPVATIIQPIINEKSLFQPNHNLREDGAIVLPYDDKSTAKRTVSSHPNLNISANIMPTQTFGQSAQHPNAYPLSRLNATGQSRVVIPTEPQRGILENLQHNIPSTEVKSVARPDFMDGKTSLVDPRIPPIEKMVSEHVNLTDLSASLVQLLGNGPQLPQLYAALNSKSSTGIPSISNAEGSVLPVLSATIEPDQAIGSQRQYDPIRDSTVSLKPEISNNPPGALPNTTVQTSVSDAKSEAQLKSLKLSSFPNGPNGTDSLQVGSSAEQPDHKRQSLCQLEPNTSCEVAKENNELGSGESKKAQKENEKVQESDQLEVVDKEGADDGKKSKDLKGIRAFKFSLVEFVKELLKPAWKEGQISKDAYKTIVKKVVDKVTGTMQGPNIPQTQEKIDHYLSISKPKLTKLVQAYVEKNQKA